MCFLQIRRVLTNTSTSISQTIASLVDTKFYFSEIVCENNKKVLKGVFSELHQSCIHARKDTI